MDDSISNISSSDQRDFYEQLQTKIGHAKSFKAFGELSIRRDGVALKIYKKCMGGVPTFVALIMESDKSKFVDSMYWIELGFIVASTPDVGASNSEADSLVRDAYDSLSESLKSEVKVRWTELKNKNSTQLMWACNLGKLKNRSTWDALQNEMIDKMSRLLQNLNFQ